MEGGEPAILAPNARSIKAPARCGCSAAGIARRGAELQRRQPRVQRHCRRPARRGCPIRDQPPVVDHRDAVGVTHRRQPVRDDQRRAAAPSGARSACWTSALALGVERRGRFVEQQDRPVGENRAGDRQPLPLAAGQPDAALAQEARVALGQPRR